MLGLLGSDVSLENSELTERWWHKATDPRRIAELPRLKMNSISDSGVCGYCVLLIRLLGDWEAFFILEESRKGVEGDGEEVKREK